MLMTVRICRSLIPLPLLPLRQGVTERKMRREGEHGSRYYYGRLLLKIRRVQVCGEVRSHEKEEDEEEEGERVT